MLETGSVSDIALILVTDEDFDTKLNKTLALLGFELSISRCYLFLDSADGTTTSNTHEWCIPGIAPQMQTLQDIPYADIPSWKKILDAGAVCPVTDVMSLPSDVRNVLEPQGILSIIIAPFRIDNVIRGFFGFDECSRVREWNRAEIDTLKTITSLIETAYSKKLLGERLESSEENFRSFFNTVDDIIVIADLDGRLLFANAGATEKLGYSLEEMCGKNVLDLHPEDKREEASRILDAMFRKKIVSCPLELATRDGSRIPVETRVWFGEWNGQHCIFGVSKDISAEQAALQKFERLFRNNPAAMALSTVDERKFIDVNSAFLEKFGYRREEVVGISSSDLFLFVDDRRWLRAKNELLGAGSIHNRELTLRHKDGSLISGLFSGEIIESQGQRFFLTVMIDITEQSNLQAELKTERQRLANIIEGTRLGTWEWNIQTGETTFNDRWAEMLGYSLHELEPTDILTWEHFAHPEDLVESGRLLKRHFEGLDDYYEFESRMRHKNGNWVWVLDRGKVIERDKNGQPLKMYGTHSDITEKKLMEQQIRELAVRDPLTGVYNRRYIFERLEKIALEYSRAGRKFCVAILDIDHFKAVNDTYGHQAGDFVLAEFAEMIGKSIRQYDLLGRYGGEEFIIVYMSTELKETVSLIERIMTTVREKTFRFDGRDIRFTFSGGVAESSEFNRDTIAVESMIALADKRLYEAKEGGRDRCVGSDSGS